MGKKTKKKTDKIQKSNAIENNIMTYKYPPIYKYGFLLLVIYMLMKHQKIMSQDKLLTNSIIVTLIVGIVDYMVINNHPFLFSDGLNEGFENNSSSYDDDVDDLDDFDYDSLNDYDLSIEKEIESLNSQHNNKNNQHGKTNAIQINYLKKPSETNKNSRQFYSTDVIY